MGWGGVCVEYLIWTLPLVDWLIDWLTDWIYGNTIASQVKARLKTAETEAKAGWTIFQGDWHLAKGRKEKEGHLIM